MPVPYSITKQVSKLRGKTHYYASPQIIVTKTTRDLGRMVSPPTCLIWYEGGVCMWLG